MSRNDTDVNDLSQAPVVEDTENSGNNSTGVRPRKNGSKTLILYVSIALAIFLLGFILSKTLPMVISVFFGNKDAKELSDQGAKKLTDIDGQDQISFILPKKPKKPEPKPEPHNNPFVAVPQEQPKANPFEKPAAVKKGPENYTVYKASRGSIVPTRSSKAQVQAEEKQKLAEQKLKEAEELKKKAMEQAEEEARLYPYGFTYRLVNGKMVKIPKTSASSIVTRNIYEDRGSAIGSTIFQPQAEAMTLKADKNFLLEKGTFIPCSLDTKIVSMLTGGVNCTISDDVYSQNGNVLLIEKGSRVFGYYENGQIKVGMDRIFVIWQEIRTPEGVVIPVDSGSASPLGDAGTDGYVDYHWALRFTSAVLVSIVDDVFNSALNGDTSGNKEFRTDKTKDTTNEMATETLKRFIDVEPTLYKNQGDKAGIYVNKDIDFSKVYELDLADKE